MTRGQIITQIRAFGFTVDTTEERRAKPTKNGSYFKVTFHAFKGEASYKGDNPMAILKQIKANIK